MINVRMALRLDDKAAILGTHNWYKNASFAHIFILKMQLDLSYKQTSFDM